MEHLVGNGRHLYRRISHLVRTPIYKTLNLSPVSNANYDVGNTYVQNLPTRDFPTSTGGVYAIHAGHDMRKAYLTRVLPSGAYQIWRNNNAFPNYDSGYVFYNGNYSPTTGLTQGSAFIRIAAYEFSIPETYRTSKWKVDSVTVTTRDIGTVLTSGRASEVKTNPNRYSVFAWDASTSILPSNNEWRNKTRYIMLGAFNPTYLTSHDPYQLYNQCQQELAINQVNTDACNNTGAAFPLWESWPGGQVTYVDGTIPHAPNNPHFQQHAGNAGIADAIKSTFETGSFYLTVIPAVNDSGSDNSTVTNLDYPHYYYSGSGTSISNWWLCERIQITGCQLKLICTGD